MSTGGQIAGGVVGGVIGAVVGGPTGAIYGAQIGMSVGGLLDPPKGPTVEGPRLSDLSVQTSTYGQFIPRTYGTIGLSGNVFWLENNKIKEVVKKKKSGGKGGGSSSTVKTYTYFATFAVGLCEGPIAGVRRIWVGPDLVYDAGSDDLETIISSNQASAKFTIYTGTDTQQPDPRMQAEIGVADCPAYRGLAYIVVKDLPLASYGNSVAGAQVKVEVADFLSTTDIVTDHSMPATAAWSQLAYNGRRLFAVRNSQLGAISATGEYWSSASLPATASWGFISAYDDKFCAIAPASGLSAVSADGIIWQQGSLPDTRLWSIIHRTVSGWFTATGNDGSYSESFDGLVWGPIKSMPSASQWVAAANSSNMTVIISSYGPSNDIPRAATLDSSGVVNETVMSDVGAVWKSIAYNGDIFCAVGPDEVSFGLNGHFCTSNDGVSWQYGRLPVNGTITDICYGGGVFLAVGYFSTSCKMCVSLDGLNWRALSESSSFQAISCEWTGAFFSVIGSSDGVSKNIRVSVSQPLLVPLSDIVAKEASRSSLIKLTDIDTSDLNDSVTGFKVTATGSIRNAIEPLRGAWPFDVVQSGYKINVSSRGSSPVVTIPIGELAIDTQLTESREMDSQIPQNVTVKYIDRERDYDQNEQRAQRDNTEAVNSLVLELPVVLSATQSAQVADKLIRIYALEKSDFSFTLPPPYRYLEPGDVVTIAAADAEYVLRLVSVNQTADGRLECAGRPSSASTYTSIAPGDGGQTGGSTIPLAGATVGLIIDCPVIDEGLQDSPGFAVGMNGYSAGWPGGVLFRTADSGQTWDDLQAITGRATAGFSAGVLSASAGNLIQRGGSLTVSLIGGTLESVTEAQMLNGSNIAAYGVNGRWEIIRFQNATLNGDGTYTLDTFWRGDKGTEWATGLHAVNDYFLLMTDPDLAFVGMPTDSIGQPRDYRAVTAGADIDSAASQAFTYSAVNLETLSGVHPRGSRSAGDLTVTWQRRTRVGGAWRDYVDASLGEATQAYEIDIMDGSTVKRTISAVTPTVLYTDAMQVTDFGSPQASVTVNIYQLSAVVGRGYKLEATL